MRLAFLLPLLLAGAQEHRAPACIAVVGAKIHTGTAVIESGTIVIRDGLITAVGADVGTPTDADVIDGKGLHVYPGFIDALTAQGLPETKRTPEERKKVEGTPHDFTKDPLGGMDEANRKGIHPDFSAAEAYTLDAEALARIHRGGFAGLHVSPKDEYFAGKGAFVVANGGTRRESLRSAVTGISGSLWTVADGYPTTPMGVMAHLRQVLHDAMRLKHVRSVSDTVLESLFPLFAGSPLFLEANSETEIVRALALADEFKLRLILTGGREAGLACDAIAKAKIPVILSLKFPKEPKRPKNPEAAKPIDDEDPRYEETPKPRKQYEDEKREWEKRVRGAITLHEAGVPICFSTSGLKEPAEALKQIGILVAKGLPREAALKALTEAPAALFRAFNFSSITPGKPAHLTVLTAPLGDREAKVRYVVADGFKFPVKAEKSAPPEIDLTGAWTITAEKSDLGPFEAGVVFKQAGRDLTGTLRSKLFGEAPLTGSVSGKGFQFSARVKIEGDDAELEFRGDLKEGKLSGSAGGAAGDDIKWTGKKPE